MHYFNYNKSILDEISNPKPININPYAEKQKDELDYNLPKDV